MKAFTSSHFSFRLKLKSAKRGFPEMLGGEWSVTLTSKPGDFEIVLMCGLRSGSLLMLHRRSLLLLLSVCFSLSGGMTAPLHAHELPDWAGRAPDGMQARIVVPASELPRESGKGRDRSLP